MKLVEILLLQRTVMLGQGQPLFVRSARSVMQNTYGCSRRLLSRNRRENRLRFDKRFGLSELDVVM